jgi:hypothetical protein
VAQTLQRLQIPPLHAAAGVVLLLLLLITANAAAAARLLRQRRRQPAARVSEGVGHALHAQRPQL